MGRNTRNVNVLVVIDIKGLQKFNHNTADVYEFLWTLSFYEPEGIEETFYWTFVNFKYLQNICSLSFWVKEHPQGNKISKYWVRENKLAETHGQNHSLYLPLSQWHYISQISIYFSILKLLVEFFCWKYKNKHLSNSEHWKVFTED